MLEFQDVSQMLEEAWTILAGERVEAGMFSMLASLGSLAFGLERICRV